MTCELHLGPEDELCSRCHVPLCHRCRPHVFAEKPSQPLAALANDFWVGFASNVIHRHTTTYLELVCTSPCVLSSVCCVLKAEKSSSVFHEQAHMQRHRTRARGNITLFPLPLDEVAKELRRLDSAGPVHLPRTGTDLQPFIKVILKSNGPLPASLIVQAVVRRQVVLELIDKRRRCGHPSYTALNDSSAMQQVHRKAQNLPVN